MTKPTNPEKTNPSKEEQRVIAIINHLILGFSSKNSRRRSKFRESLSLTVSSISTTIFFPSFPHFGQGPIWDGNRDVPHHLHVVVTFVFVFILFFGETLHNNWPFFYKIIKTRAPIIFKQFLFFNGKVKLSFFYFSMISICV